MLTLQEVKNWLRLEQEYETEDVLLQSLIDAAEEYLKNAVPDWVDLTGNPLARLLAMVLIADWYENREAIGQTRSEVRPIVQSMMAQLQNAYPKPEEVTEE